MVDPRPRARRPLPFGAGTAAGDEADRGTRQMEGYLYWQAEKARAARAARAFTRLLPWLTTAQADEVEHHYIHTDLQNTRRQLEHLRSHITAVRAQYEARYHQLRTRCTVTALTVTAVAVSTAAYTVLHPHG
ncbi:cytochrome C oxidase subunit I [Kitasatospora sp. NPDC001539]|uniref:cytochrome C oxidase subunit I n=1 Tax=Kitasatospora sp. NPDC001539 TaxID=3154384 RepID=UPI003328E469